MHHLASHVEKTQHYMNPDYNYGSLMNIRSLVFSIAFGFCLFFTISGQAHWTTQPISYGTWSQSTQQVYSAPAKTDSILLFSEVKPKPRPKVLPTARTIHTPIAMPAPVTMATPIAMSTPMTMPAPMTMPTPIAMPTSITIPTFGPAVPVCLTGG